MNDHTTSPSFKVILLIFLSIGILESQPSIEYLGLENKRISCMAMWGSLLTVGTYGEGVYYQDSHNLPDSAWINAGLIGKNVTSVYPHTVGPIGWGITAGIHPEVDDSIYIYCNFMGGEFYPNSLGISDTLSELIYNLAGFPDETICGEKYAAVGAALYRQMFGDSLWIPIYESLGAEGYGVINVKTAEEVGGLVLSGGSEGYTGILLIKSTDYGDTWEYLYPPGPTFAFDFSVDSTYTDLETIFVSHGNRISRSRDRGNTWEIVHDDGWYSLNDIIYDPITGFVFACGGDGLDTSSAILFYSSNHGDTWSQIPLNNLSGPVVNVALSWEGYLYFAAPYRGVFRLPISDLAVDAEYIPRQFALLQNYPNPFNPITTIQYELPQRSYVQITIYDLLGRKVTTLVSEIQDAGYKSALWDATNVSSGMYFYQIRAGDFVQTRKMMLLR